MKAPRSGILQELLRTEEGSKLFDRMQRIPKQKIRFRWKGNIYTYYKSQAARIRDKKPKTKPKPKPGLFKRIMRKIPWT